MTEDKGSKQIQFRLNPTLHEQERTAYETLLKLEGEGKDRRDIMTAALNALGANGEVPKRVVMRDVIMKLNRLEKKIDESYEDLSALIISALQNLDLTQYTHRDTGRTVAEDMGEYVPEDVQQRIIGGLQGKSFDVGDE